MILLAIVFAATAFDSNMSVQDRKKTGLYKLSDEEKNALQQWVDNNYNAPKQKKANPQTSEVLNNGAYLKLSDNTIWNVRPEDTTISQSWISQVEIQISPSGDPQYPYKLTNTLSQSYVFAKKIDKIPSSTTPPTKKK